MNVAGRPVTPRMMKLLQHAATEEARIVPIDSSIALILEQHGLVVLDQEGMITLTDAGREALRSA